MLRGLRKASSNWIGKAIMTTVMGVLIVSFGIWGIADIFRGFGRSTLATIGKTEIGIEQFRQIYNERLQQIGRQFGRPLSGPQARAMGIDRQVLAQVVAEATLDETVRRRGLGISDADVTRAITTDPNFRGVNGSFDPVRFAQIIRQAGYTEQRFIAEQRRVSLRRQITSSVTEGYAPAKTLIEMLIRVQSEQRAIEFVRLTSAQAGDIAAPTAEQLSAYFEERKALFRAPEYRKIAVLAVLPEELGKWITVSDDDAKKAYEARLSRLATPERRAVQQIVFANADEAKAARERIAAGLSFDDLAKERNLKPSDIDLGTVTKTGMVDSSVADAAFAAPVNEVSVPVQGRFGTVLVRVTKIEPGNTPSYESLADALKGEIAVERARTQVQDLHNKIEDERGGGTSVAEAAKKLGLTAIAVDAIDRAGRGPDGKAIDGLPKGVDLIAPLFSSDVGVENDPVQARNGYVWYEVLGVTPSRERTLEEVKDQVEARWKDDQVAARLRDKAQAMTKAIGAGGRLADVAAREGLAVETATGIKRGSAPANVPAAAVDTAFKTAKDTVADTQGASPTERIVLKVTDVVVPPVDLASKEAVAVADALKRMAGEELLAQYVTRLESEIGTTINQTAFAQATGAATEN